MAVRLLLTSRAVEVILAGSVFAVMVFLTRWDTVVHGGDQLVMRVLARELFSDRSLTQNIIHYFFDWRNFGYPEDNYTPLPILIWAVLIKLTGGWEGSFLLFNALVWSVQVFLWADISHRLVGSRVPGWLTFALFSFSFGVPTCVTTGLKEPLALLFMLLFLRCCLNSESQHQFVKAGVFLGLSYLSRYNAQMVVPLALAFAGMPWHSGRLRESLRQSIKLLLGFVVVASPWWIRNYVAFGNPFEYLVTKYPFSTHWSGYFVQRYFWDFPPTPANLYSHYGFFFVWEKVLQDWSQNLSVFLHLSSLHWIVALAGIVLAWQRGGLSTPVRGMAFVLLIALSQVPAVFMATLARYHLLPFVFLFFAAALVITYLLRRIPTPSTADSVSRFRLEWVVVGLGIAALALAADWLGIGEPGFGLVQTVLLVAGLGIAIGGATLPVGLLPRHSRQVALAASLLPLILSPVRAIEGSLRSALRDKVAPIFVLHEKIGEGIRQVSRPDDVVMMSYPAIVYYYTGLRSVMAPIDITDPVGAEQYRSLEREKIDRVIDYYGVTLFVDYQAQDVARVLSDCLTPISRVEGMEDVTIYRIRDRSGTPEDRNDSRGQ